MPQARTEPGHATKPVTGFLETNTMTDAQQNPAADLALKPGDRVLVVQQIPHSNTATQSRVEGTFVRMEQKKTGSWFAHSKDDKLWLDRLVIQKDDGELVMCNLDQYSHIEKI